MFEIIKLLLPLIIQLLGNKQKAGQAVDSEAAINCWRSPSSRATFVAELLTLGIDQGRILPDEMPLIVAGLNDMADSPLMPLFIEALYAQPALSEAP